MAFSDTFDRITKSIFQYEDGDVLLLATWVQDLQTLRAEVPTPHGPQVAALEEYIKTALREGPPGDFLAKVTEALDGLSATMASPGLDDVAVPQQQTAPVSSNSLWEAHGPTFISETKARLARAQELVLALEAGQDPEALGELFRIFHTIKGEAGFLHRNDLVAVVHGTETLLDELRSGTVSWDAGTADRLLADSDRILALLGKDSPVACRKSLGRRREDSEEILRIPAAKIDALVSQVGELLVALDSDTGTITTTVRKLSRGLQQSALRLRTEPLQGLMGRLRRGTRDLARDLGKNVEVYLVGEDLELDRHLIAELEEPLMHLIRNSLDHGIEPPTVRTAKRKPEVGALRIGARRRGNRIEIEVSDDGAGLDAKKIWKKVVEKGLATGEPPADVTQIYPWIFRPGFSTAEGVSTVSGRGVGMDIVSQTVQRARGRVDLSSTPDQGMTVTLSFPLSTAVLEGLVVRLGSRRYVVPVHSARESLLVAPGTLRQVASGARVFSLRGDPIPAFSLREVLDCPGVDAEVPWGLVLEDAERQRHLMLVDEVETKREVVIRSLGRLFRNLKGVSSATILTGGQLALVLDVDQLTTLVGEREC